MWNSIAADSIDPTAPRRTAAQLVNSSFMKISKVEALAISIPLQAAVSDAVRRITHRDHLIVRITTESGLTGEGFTLGYDASKAMVSMVDTIFRPILEGASALDAGHLWGSARRRASSSSSTASAVSPANQSSPFAGS